MVCGSGGGAAGGGAPACSMRRMGEWVSRRLGGMLVGGACVWATGAAAASRVLVRFAACCSSGCVRGVDGELRSACFVST